MPGATPRAVEGPLLAVLGDSGFCTDSTVEAAAQGGRK